MPLSLSDRYRGSILGLATGDALGAPLEFAEPGSFTPVSDMVGGGVHDLPPGYWTDDTAMALCLAVSLVERGFDLRDQAKRYLRWYRQGYMSPTGVAFDVGNTVRSALERFERDGEPRAGSTDPEAAGNGSLMRLAPVALRFAKDPDLAIRRAAESSLVTHGAREAVDACRYMAGLIVGALSGACKDALLAPRYSPLPGLFDEHPLAPAVDRVARGSFREKGSSEIRGGGYVVESLEAALWCFHGTHDFRAGCLRAANLGHDADTTAAIFGQLAGAFYGVRGIPGEWLDALYWRSFLESIADELLRCAIEDCAPASPEKEEAVAGDENSSE
ncbi:MAG: ADP-ribosylglycohydrolase family protein [Bacillota bacterium]